MKSLPQPFRTGIKGFTLIEMIGVLAIMAILAAAVAPNALRSIERAAVRGEADTLHSLGEQLKLYVCDTGIFPTSTNWDTALASYASLNSIDLLYNHRQPTSGPGALPRVFVFEPVIPPAVPTRALFLSSMRTGITLPTPATVSANFNAIWTWNSADTSLANVPPPCLAAWVPTLREFLVIERVNLSSVPLLQFELRNQSTATQVVYRIFGVNGNQIASGQVPIRVGTTEGSASPKCRSNQRINLYDTANNLNYSYVVSTNPKTFVFDGTSWTPQ